jgi:NADPH-dependent 2,4-dienoyl-CoA reductase/sulfur reductase-like enzyme
MRELTCQVAVVGAGPAGLAAAAAAAERGADVLVLDENPAVGGQIWREARETRGPRPEVQRLRARATQARFDSGVTVFHAEAAPLALHTLHGTAQHDARTTRVRAAALVLATGATERFLPFPGWTLPGVFGVGGLQALMKGGLDVRQKRILVAGSGPLLLAVAASFVKAGAIVVAVVEQAPKRAVARFALGLVASPGKLVQGARLLAALRGVPLLHSAWVHTVEGGARAHRALVRIDGHERAFDVDFVACGHGLVPATQLGELLGCARNLDAEGGGLRVGEDLATSVHNVFAAGETTGIGGVDAALAEGELAGLAAARAALGVELSHALARARTRVARHRRFARRLERAYTLRDELRTLAHDDTLVCRCEDVPLGALRPFDDMREAKLATRCGMGPCQARVCGAALQFVLGWGRETPRPPLVPIPFAALAGAAADEPRARS